MMIHTAQPLHSPSRSHRQPVKTYVHLKLFQKFALIFLAVVTVPVILIALYTLHQSQITLLESCKWFGGSLKISLENLSLQQQESSRAALEKLHQQFSTINQLAFRSLQERFIHDARDDDTSAQAAAALGDRIHDESEQIQREMAEIRHVIDRQLQAVYTRYQENTTAHIDKNLARLSSTLQRHTAHKMGPVIMLMSVLAVLIGIVVARAIIRPINNITAVAQNISKGNVSQSVEVFHSHDEIELLSQSFQDTTEYLRKIVQGAQKISNGEFTDDVTPVSEHDALGHAFQKMIHYLRDIATLVSNIAHGDLSRVGTPKSEKDVLGNAVYRMTLYLQHIAQTAKKVAGGNLSERIHVQSEQDFLGNAFSEMIAKLRHLVSKIRTGADQLMLLSMETHSRAQAEVESVEKISLSVEETSSSMRQMAATIDGVDERMEQLSASVGDSSLSIEELDDAIHHIAVHGEQLAAASEETSRSIQAISASLQHIAETAEYSRMLSNNARQDAIYGRESVEKTIQSMSDIQHTIEVTAEAIRDLNTRTESIDTILAVIKDISDQTSLLSINASIIAQKAGERGRGFHVIADKVRKLADRSQASAKEIAQITRDVRKESSHAVKMVAVGSARVQEGVKLAELAGKALDKIISRANESSSVAAKIAETTDEQTTVSHYVIESMEQVLKMVNQIKSATNEQEQSSACIMTQVEQMLLLSQQVKQSTSEQSRVVKHVLHAMDDIRTLSQMTSERALKSTQSASLLLQHADALTHLVSQFTI